MLKDAVDIEEHEKEDICIQHLKERGLKTPRPCSCGYSSQRRLLLRLLVAHAMLLRRLLVTNAMREILCQNLHDLLSCGPKPETPKYVVFILVCLGGMCAASANVLNKALLRVLVVTASFSFYIILLLQLK